MNNEYIHIGKIYQNSILKNSWFAYIKNIKYIYFINEHQKLIFINIDEILTPFFILSYKKINKNKFLLHFDAYAKSENFINRDLYLNIQELKTHKINYGNYYYLINYEAIDIHKGYLGQIHKINDELPQSLFEIYNTNNNIMILIPIVDVFINDINTLKKIILLDLPDGLIDLFIK